VDLSNFDLLRLYDIYIPDLTSKSKKHPTLVQNQSSEKKNPKNRFCCITMVLKKKKKNLIITFITSGPFSGSFMKTLGSYWN